MYLKVEPRQCSYVVINTSSELLRYNSKTDQESETMHGHIQSACESGWDFSTRWLSDMTKMESIRTSDVIPVDLNSFICLSYRILSKFYGLLGVSTNRLNFNSDGLFRQLEKFRQFNCQSLQLLND